MENNYLKLADIPTGEECVIVKVHGHGSFRNRIVEMDNRHGGVPAGGRMAGSRGGVPDRKPAVWRWDS